MTLRPRLSLDGQWQFWIDPEDSCSPNSLSTAHCLPITVPGPLQAQIPNLRTYSGPAWYRRAVEIPPEWFGERVIILGFGAAEYLAEAWFNDVKVGEHEGGYLPFEFDVTHAARTGQNTITVRVTDPTELFPEIPHGKQGWYGPLSGLWQSVWVESRAPQHLRNLRITPHNEQVEVSIELSPPLDPGDFLRVEILDPEGAVCARAESRDTAITLPAPNPKLWDVGAPNLYTAQVALCRGASRAPTDALADTFGFRTVETRDGQILLNGRPIYLRGALDQDYYPDLICTPPSLDYIEAQFRQAQALGLNCLRVHIKVADPRYYAAADRAGLLIWTEVPNWSRLTADSMRRGRETLEGMIRRDWNHPSIILWTIVNEAWGTELAINPDHCSWLGEMYDWVKSLDPTRLVVDNSACAPDFHVRSDLDDYHFYASIPEGAHLWDKWIREFANRAEWIYNAPPSQGGEQGRGHAPLLVSEFGNWGLPDTGPLFEHYGGEPWWFETGWDWGTAEVYAHGVEERFRALCLDRVFGDFAGLARAAQWAEYEALKYEIETIRLYPSIAGYVVTEFTDVHWECNGLLDMLRNPKVFCSELADLNGDTLIIPHAARAAQWAGEAVDVELSLSHVGPQPIRGARLQWTLAGEPEFGIAGQVVDISIDPFTSLPLEPPHFRLPSVATPRMARLQLTLNAQNDRIIARNHLDLSIFPRPPAPQAPLFCPDESLAPRLASLGYSLTSNPSSNSIALLTRLDSTARRRLQEGEHVLFLAESPDDLETSIPRLVLKARQGTVWADTSAATFTWYRKDKLGPIIPGDGRLGLACASITPKTVIALFGTREFEHDVLAGIFAGWLRYGAALIFKLPVGRGMLLATTLRLKDQLGVDPVATAVFNALVNELSALL